MAFGMPESRFQDILASRDNSAVLALDEHQLEQCGDYGPASYYYLARWIESRPALPGSTGGVSRIPGSDAGSVPSPQLNAPSLDAASERVRYLLRLAYDRNEGLVRREAGRALAVRLQADGAAGVPGTWDKLAAFDEAYHASIGPDWPVDRSYLDALDGLGRDTELLAAIAALRDSFPAESSADADALLYYEGTASQRLGRAGWAAPLRSLFFERPTSDWTGKALDFVESLEPPAKEFSVLERRVARMRLDVAGRDYGVAYHEAVRAPGLVFSYKASPEVVADAGKAFLYSGEASEGVSRFARLEESARSEAASLGDLVATDRAERVAWTAAFYRARFYRALERWSEAASLFETLADTAPTPADADAARWYTVECAPKIRAPRAGKAKAAAVEAQLRGATLAALERAAAAWSDPGVYTDLVDSLFRDAVQARDWNIIDRMARGPAAAASPALAARCAYVAARSLELGLYSPTEATERDILRGKQDFALDVPPRSLATDAYRALMNDPAAPLHYRALAAWRLGEEPSLLPPERSAPAAPKDPDPVEAFLAGFLRFDLPDLLLKEATKSLPTVDRESLRRLAVLAAQDGHPDISMRLIVALMGRPDWDPRRSDFELLYPRPYLSDLRSLRPRLPIPEPILLGLLRSESYFQADVVSGAGAVGLAQIMPSTAAEIAQALGIAKYDLRTPRDNLRFGVVYFSDLLAETGRPLEAMWAYNAGKARMKRWLAEASDLPDDLKLEALGIEETRQYGRNILQAAVMYGELYYGTSVAAMTAEIVDGESSWLQPANQPITGP